MVNDFLERHRPRRLSEVVGNERAKRAVHRMLTSIGIPRGVVFDGPRGCGKTTLARILLRGQLCEGREPETADSCGRCFFCRQGFRSAFEVERGLIVRDGVKLTVADVTSDLELVGMYASVAVLYDEAHEAPAEVQARLRTLVENGSSTNLVLCTSEFDKLDPALRLRLARVRVAPPTEDEIVAHLSSVLAKENVRHDAEVIRDVARQNQCLPRRCLTDLVTLMLQIDSLTVEAVDRLRIEP